MQQPNLSASIKSMWALTCDRRFMILIPQLCWTGVSIAYYSGNLGEMMTGSLQNYSDQDQFFWSNLAMVAFGFG